MPKTRVLVVDDEPNILLSLEFLLEEDGYDVHVAHDGDEALAAAAAVRPSLVLLDVAMPRKDGYEVCRRLRGSPEFEGLKIVMLTAKGQPLERMKGVEVGADLYVTKPFSSVELLEKLRALLGP